MDMVILIVALSSIIWYLIDRFKPIWDGTKLGKYVTIAIAAIMSFGVVFSFDLDLIYGLELFNSMTIAGKILTGLALMSGSSAVSEIIGKIKGK